jgi:hypothetical protein
MDWTMQQDTLAAASNRNIHIMEVYRQKEKFAWPSLGEGNITCHDKVSASRETTESCL